MIVIGEPGAVAAAGGSLTVTVERSGTAAPGAVHAETRSFAAGIAARQNDALHLSYTVDGDENELTLVLDVPLAGVNAPSCAACGAGWSIVGAPAGGLAPVDLAVLDDPTPPFVIANVDGGAVIVVDSTAPVSIPAASGGQVCVHRMVDGVPGPSRCDVVP